MGFMLLFLTNILGPFECVAKRPVSIISLFSRDYFLLEKPDNYTQNSNDINEQA